MKALLTETARVFREVGTMDGMACLTRYWAVRSDLRGRMQPLRKRYSGAGSGISSEKYLNTDFYSLVNLHRAFSLGIYREKRKLRILDLGTGMGYFPYICSLYGHEAAGLDLDSTELYNEAVELLGVTRFSERLEANEPINVPGRWDVITAFMICFNGHKTDELWNAAEWDAFLRNLKEHNLANGGRVHLSFNVESEEAPIDPELVANFLSRGASCEGTTVKLGPGYRFD